MKLKKMILISLAFILLILSVCIIKITILHYQTRDGICIVGYHGVVSDKEKDEKYSSNRYFLSQTQFEEQIKYLYEHQYVTLSMDDIYDYYLGKKEVHKKSIALTFDDGYKNFNTVVKPILDKYHFQATCFVIGKHLDDSKEQFLKSKDIVNTNRIQYYSHSYNLHQKAKGFDRKIIQDMSLKEISNDFQLNSIDSSYFAFPYGRSKGGVEKILKEHHVKLAFSYNQMRHMTREDQCYYLPRYMIIDIMPQWYFEWICE